MDTPSVLLLVLVGSSLASLVIARMVKAPTDEQAYLEEGVPSSQKRLRSEIADLDDAEAQSVLRVVKRLKSGRTPEAPQVTEKHSQLR